jgi:ectoine hydroxylase-related dioxygenase (phytanoyl-CoA dioxygenase family)
LFPQAFAERGYLVVERLFDPALIDSVRDEYQAQYGSRDPGNLPLHMNVGDRRLHLPIQLRGPILEADFYANRMLMAILAALFRAPFLIDSVTCVTALPGADDQRHHCDHPRLFSEPGSLAASLPPYAITVAIPLVDLNPTTGTTKLFPSSMGAREEADGTPPKFGEEICPYVARGGCFLMDYRLWHRGMRNAADYDRPVLYIVYAREWFTDVINFAMHPRIAMNLTDLAKIPAEHRPMFRRLAAQGLHDTSVNDLLAL